MKDLISKVEANFLITGKLSKLWQTRKAVELGLLENIPKRDITTVSDVNINSVKNAFGRLFYGALEPVNGVSPKNRRFSNGGNDWSAEAAGACVWKRIGTRTRWSGRAHWYSDTCAFTNDSDVVFDKLSAEHIDLVINGIRNRKDQIDVAKELFELRNLIKFELDVISNIDNDPKSSIQLTKSYKLNCIVCSSKMNEKELPFYETSFTATDIHIQNDEVSIAIPQSIFDLNYLKSQGITVANYRYSNHVSVPLLTKLESVPDGSLDWSVPYYVFGISRLLQDSSIDAQFSKSLQSKEKAITLLEQAQTKYAGRLLANGLL